MGINAKKCLYEGVITPIALYGTEACGIRSAVRSKVDVFEMKCWKSLAKVTRTDKVRYKEVHSRVGI